MADGIVGLLDTKIAQAKSAQAADWPDDQYFELYAAQNIVAAEAITSSELEDGRLGAGRDGGIDALYVFVDGHLVKDDTDPSDFKRRPEFVLHLIQAKRETSFTEKAADKFVSSAKNLLNLGAEIETAKNNKLYQKVLIEKLNKFRDLYLGLAGKNPDIEFKYYYVTRGETDDIDDAVRLRTDEIAEEIYSSFPDAKFSFEFIGAKELLELTRRRPAEELELSITEHLAADPKGFIALARLDSYNRFMRDKDGGRLGHLFDDNVRAYQNSVEVNKNIAISLRNPDEVDFWYLNNGITILCENAVVPGKRIKITDPQIINGLQTSFEILRFFDEEPDRDDDRHVLVKVLPSASPAARDRVIKATNSQTNVPPASLRASDNIHLDIEDALRNDGFFYDRRKNLYRNEGKPRDKIIGISELAQAVMATMLARPNDARARPSNLIKSDTEYKKLFNRKYNLKMYSTVAAVRKLVEEWFRQNTPCDRADRNNVLFYVLLRVCSKITNRVKPNSKALAEMDVEKSTDRVIQSAFNEVWKIYQKHGGDARAAKGSEMVKEVIALATKKK
ncbi:AIPR family protein [Aurantiacibacter poecillastricola]|uniref:AIPR family protein n=1 Tax=Aurantiacibacter poecillastricola TaxID=3064385 RepID=UPI00273FD644|nr:AIPR family protein [Aurantiacibacter sp. 219JJ12-13]MDP5260822.1 AIPR family protein [Aurantiacibacter sp. 219JJ12-13]